MLNCRDHEIVFWKKFIVVFVFGQILTGFIAGLNLVYFHQKEYLLAIRFINNFLVISFYFYSSILMLKQSKVLCEKLYQKVCQILIIYYIISLFIFSSLINFTTFFSYIGNFLSLLITRGIYDTLLIDNFKILFGLI